MSNFFFQGSWGLGSHKNFEVVIPHRDGGLAHYWRDNAEPGCPWHGPIRFGRDDVQGVTVIESDYGPGNFELVAVRRDHKLDFYYRDNQPTPTWHGPFGIPLPREFGARGYPSLFQGTSGQGEHPDFSLVVPRTQGRLISLRRNNATLQWQAPTIFGRDAFAIGTSIAASPLGGPTIASCDMDDVICLHDSKLPPSLLAGSGGVHGGPSMLRTDYDSYEIIVPAIEEGKLVHFYGSDTGWQRFSFGRGNYLAASLIQSDYTSGDKDGNYHGNFEVVALRYDRQGFDFYWRNSLTFEWSEPQHVF